MKFRLLCIILTGVFLGLVLTTAALAQEEPPPPYAGLENPFAWNDTSAQETGKGLYQQSCLGCHGARGDNLARSDFSSSEYSQSLEERPDSYFRILSEGRLDIGMPPFKSSLSEEQRWQVLTYLWFLGQAVPSEVMPTPAQPPVIVKEANGILLLTVPERVQSGQSMVLTAVLLDAQWEPIQNATVEFLIKVDFFVSGLMEIGEVVSNEQGVVVLEYTPRQWDEVEIVARYQAIETTATVTVAGTAKVFYRTEAGISLPAPTEMVFLGSESTLEPGKKGQAPTSVFQISGGVLLWVGLAVTAVVLIWFTYSRVIYQVLRIPIVSEISDTETRLVPSVMLAVVIVLGILLVLMFLIGPYSHPHLLQ